ncbi:transporter, major facilitator family protein [Besnoitia besnoiti]|uniref:Transporter, major facilitator family protein n=1 Tax=Besnoitia besnoiti TaxID=94643 RepID=A0A2A9MP79_BESBE|nr:transporter, major facilitator family protein [Besnoitia besnoiti]PFH38126.1 transporter, major facilitator family protein [Besnoitia besnoiti]
MSPSFASQPPSTRSSSPPSSVLGFSRLSSGKRSGYDPLIELPPIDVTRLPSPSFSATPAGAAGAHAAAPPPRLLAGPSSFLPSAFGSRAGRETHVSLFDEEDDLDADDLITLAPLPATASAAAASRCARLLPSKCTYTARAVARAVVPPVASSPAAARFVLCTFLYAFLHGATDQLLPAAYKALEAQLNFSPTVLGAASSLSRLAHAFACPLWGLSVDAMSTSSPGASAAEKARRSREGEALVLRFSCVGWGVCTVLLSLLAREGQLMPLMFCSGWLMAVMGPLSQKILGEAVDCEKRGTAFGSMSFFQSTGRMVSLMLTTGLSAVVFAGVAGWRFAFAFVGFLSVAFGVALAWMLPSSALTRRSLRSAPVSPAAPAASGTSGASPLAGVCGDGEGESWQVKLRTQAAVVCSLGYVFRTRSFGVMLLLGVINGMPRTALNFIVMFFQYCGLADWQASLTVSASWLAAMFVAPFVGRFGDAVHRRYPNKGRPVLAQTAILVRALLMFLILSCVPKRSGSFPVFFLLSVLVGLMAGWPGVGVNRPILTEIVLPKHRATVFSLFSTMEGVGSALLGAPVVGMLAQQVFGYSKPLTRHRPSAASSSSSTAAPGAEGSAAAAAGAEGLFQSAEDMANAEALGKALLCTTVGPWLASVFVYFLLHWTYTVDRVAANRRSQEEKAREDARAAESDAAEAPTAEGHGEAASDLELAAAADCAPKSADGVSGLSGVEPRGARAHAKAGYAVVATQDAEDDLSEFDEEEKGQTSLKNRYEDRDDAHR